VKVFPLFSFADVNEFVVKVEREPEEVLKALAKDKIWAACRWQVLSRVNHICL